MNIIQKLLAFFGRDYVDLQFHDGRTSVRPMYKVGAAGYYDSDNYVQARESNDE